MTNYEQAVSFAAAMTDEEFSSFATRARSVPTPQLTRADLDGLSPERIDEARQRGQLAELLGTPPERIALLERAARLEPISRAELRELNSAGRADLVAAYAGHIDRVTK